jgi:hypothetical protein
VSGLRQYGGVGIKEVTVRELDRLVSKTELNPLSKKTLRSVRKAVLSGTVGNAEVGTASWSVEIDSDAGSPMRIRFSFKKD